MLTNAKGRMTERLRQDREKNKDVKEIMMRDDFEESDEDGAVKAKRNPMDELKNMFDTESMAKFRQQLEGLGARIKVANSEGRSVEPMGNWVSPLLLTFFRCRIPHDAQDGL
jgi:hypothetical protein